AHSSRPITNFTTTLALRIMERMFRSWLTIIGARLSNGRFHLAAQGFGDFRGLHRIAGDAGDRDLRAHQDLVLAADLLREDAARLAERLELHAHGDGLVQARRLQVVDGERGDDQRHAVAPREPLVVEAQVAQPFGARALEELAVLGVVHDAARIGILVVHADWTRIGEELGLHARPRGDAAHGAASPGPAGSKRSRAPPGRGSARTRWRQASAVAMRP